MIYTIKMIGDLIFKLNEKRGFPQECSSRTPKGGYFEVSNGTHYLEENITRYSLVAMPMENGRTGVCSLKGGYFEMIAGAGYVSNGTHYLEENITRYSLVAMPMENGRTGVCSLKDGTKKEIYDYLIKMLYCE